MRIAASICAVVVLALSGCGGDSTVPQPPIEPTESAFDRQVRENCEIVAVAIRAHYAEHGEYVRFSEDLIPYLPDRKRLVNPWTGEATDPVGEWERYMAPDPVNPGTTGFRWLRSFDVFMDYTIEGYLVVGRGERCDIVLSDVENVDLYLAQEEAVRENCRVVVEAAEAYALDNGGEYPTDDREVNLAGLTVQDYLPGGTLLLLRRVHQQGPAGRRHAPRQHPCFLAGYRGHPQHERHRRGAFSGDPRGLRRIRSRLLRVPRDYSGLASHPWHPHGRSLRQVGVCCHG